MQLLRIVMAKKTSEAKIAKTLFKRSGLSIDIQSFNIPEKAMITFQRAIRRSILKENNPNPGFRFG